MSISGTAGKQTKWNMSFLFINAYCGEAWLHFDCILRCRHTCNFPEYLVKQFLHNLAEAYPIRWVCHAWGKGSKEKITEHSSAWGGCWWGSKTRENGTQKRPGDVLEPWLPGLLDVIKQGWTGCSTDGWSRESSDLFPCYSRSLSPCAGDDCVVPLSHTHH